MFFFTQQTQYQHKLAELQRGQQLYHDELSTLKEANSTLQRQQAEATSENTLVLQKQSELYHELSDLQTTKREAMELCRQYEAMYEEERERRQTDREMLRKMRAEGASETRSTAMKADSLLKQLSLEKRNIVRLGAENKSLKAQLSFLEQKLRDMERERRASSPPSRSSRRPPQDILTSTRHHMGTTLPPPSGPGSISEYPQHTEEFYHSRLLQHEFDTSAGTTQIPVDLSLAQQSLDGGDISMTTSISGRSVFPNPQQQSTVVKPYTQQYSSHHVDTTTVKHSMSQSTGIHRPVEEREDGGTRISELKGRNRKLLPHLKSSYAVELQEKRGDPRILPEKRRPQRKRAVGDSTATVWPTDEPVDQTILSEESRKRSTTYRKVAGDLGSSGSPAPSRRRIGEPTTTPEASSLSLRGKIDDSTMPDPRRATMGAGHSLRGCVGDAENCREERESGVYPPATMFEMTFSPPARSKTAAPPPERLQQQLKKQEKQKLEKPVANTSTTGGGSKKSGRRASYKPTGRRTALKTKN